MKIYNTQTRQREEFTPINSDNILIYVCGPTVYSYAHIGNARPAVAFDILVRVLRHLYPQVTYVRNITDIDDKINKAAADQGVDISVITKKFTEAYHEDLGALGVKPPSHEPKVTDNLDAIIEMIESLVASEHAYEAEGHVLFSVSSYDDYGSLSGRDPEEMLAGARVDVAPYKKDAGDFVLWKPSSDDQPGWDSPWGRGRPGWHIECSAMSAKHLGRTIDIHGGGHDLVFPHHENEIAQSTCAHGGETYANYWMHNGFVNVDAEKMSKSIGNVLLVRDLLDQAPGEAIRYVLLNAHYRAPLDWNDNVLQQAKNALDRMYNALRDMSEIEADESAEIPPAFIEALEDDLNTPKALAEMFAMVKQANTSDDAVEKSTIKGALFKCGEMLGILQSSAEEWFSGDVGSDETAEIDALVAERTAARTNKDWARADEIRDILTEKNIVIEDSADGVRWKKIG
ncbi:MAG: cysteine--tRNA ligase [Arenicella sp.]